MKPLNRKKVLQPKKKPLTPEQYLELIDEFYADAKLSSMSRFDVRWGNWSYKMNREINFRVKAEDPESAKLKYIIVYWVLKSQLLELYRKKKTLLSSINRKKLEDEAEIVKDVIMGKAQVAPINMDDLAALVLRSNNADS